MYDTWFAVTGVPLRAYHAASASSRETGSRPFTASSAAIHPETAPATVLAASGPREGIASHPRSL